MTSLEHLYLENVLPRDIPEDGKGPTIALPRGLRTFRLGASSSRHVLEGLRFMSRVRSPANCSLDYMIHPHSKLLEDPQYAVALGQVLSQLSFSRDDRPKARHLVLGCNSVVIASDEPLPCRQQMHHWNSPPSYADSAVVHRLIIEMTSHALEAHDLSAVLSFLAVDDLRAIILVPEAIRNITKNAHWERLLHANEVRRIDIEAPQQTVSAYFSDLHDALCHRYDTGTSCDSTLFPHLRTLALHLSEDERQDSGFITGLVELVRVRKELGAPLEEVVVFGKGSLGDMWDALRADVNVTLVSRWS